MQEEDPARTERAPLIPLGPLGTTGRVMPAGSLCDFDDKESTLNYKFSKLTPRRTA